MMAERDTVRQRIISSVFNRRNTSGNLEETYVDHVKIWEEAPGESRKPRYILISNASNGSGFIHKSKLNANETFSVGKTWSLTELRGIQVISPSAFNITLSRTYRWQTENPTEQSDFLVSIIRLFRNVTANAPLQIEGMADPGSGQSNRRPNGNESQGRSHPPEDLALPSPTPRRAAVRPRTPVYSDREPDHSQPASAPQPRQAPLPSSTQTSRFQPPPSLRPGPLRGGSQTPSTPNFHQSQIQQPSPPSSQLPSPPPPIPQSSPTRVRHGRKLSNGEPLSPPVINLQRSAGPTILTSEGSLDRTSQENGLTPDYGRSSPLSGVSASPESTFANTTLRPRTSSPTPSNRSIAPSASGEPGHPRRENARISFYDSNNQATLDLLISGASGEQEDGEQEEESVQATMASVEEMLEGYEWASDDVIGRKVGRGTADLIEARLLDELTALDKANIHSFLESDDRVGVVLKILDDAVAELDSMDTLLSSYKIHLNAVSDDISFIQSQNRGLQVQTQNQRTLLQELENLLQTVHVDRDALSLLTQESLDRQDGITRIEGAVTELYKALQAGQDTDMAASMERLDEYKTYNTQFCKRLFDFLSITFAAQSTMILDSHGGLGKPDKRGRLSLLPHTELERYLTRYAGLILYIREMEESVYAKICATYFSTASDLHSKQIKALLNAYSGQIRKAQEEDHEKDYGASGSGVTKITAGLRFGTAVGKSSANTRTSVDSEMKAAEAFGLILEQLSSLIYKESDFVADFLQINDDGFTFADYSGLESYFCRQAARSLSLSNSTAKLIRSAMDLIFGFLPPDIKTWLDEALAKDSMQIFGVIVTLERFLGEASERGNAFFINTLERQHGRLKALFERHVSEQIAIVEKTKLSSKKRKGIAPFVKYFPTYIAKVEGQLVGADGLEIRGSVDQAYESIVQAMFESLKHMAMDGDEEDKGQLNYHVLLIENMHHFVAETSQLELGSASAFLKSAQNIYDENLSAYVKIVLRRPFAKIIDYFEGVERLLKITAPSEVANNSNYNRSALKKVVREFNSKDVRKHIDTLFKRVEKHFTEASETTTAAVAAEATGIAAGTVMVGVWKACEEELLRITELFAKRIAQCYADSGVSLDYSAADVEAAFRRRS